MARRGPGRAPVDVTALVAHELTGPVANAMLYLLIAECHCASGSAPNPAARTAVRVACAELDRLKHLIDRVVHTERFGGALVRPESTDLGAVVRSVVDRTLAVVADASLREGVEVLGPASFVGWWDPIAVEQIIRNLLSNALKFGEGRPIQVTLESKPEGATITVQDAGMGIRTPDVERIFDRRTRAPASQGGGLGLGLWLVRELATAHGGSVGVETRYGAGAAFRVRLPELGPTALVSPPLPAVREKKPVLRPPVMVPPRAERGPEFLVSPTRNNGPSPRSGSARG